jgi:hypothetical protein
MSVYDLTIFSLDISQERTGYALVRGKSVIDYGNIQRPEDMPDKVKFSDPKFTEWISRFKDTVTDRLNMYIDDGEAPDAFCMEDLNSEWIRLVRPLYQFQAAAKLACYERAKRPVYLIHNATVKSLFKIKSASKNIKDPAKKPSERTMALAKKLKIKPVKIQIVDKVNKLFGMNLGYEENDEADAISLAVTLMNQIKSRKVTYNV